MKKYILNGDEMNVSKPHNFSDVLNQKIQVIRVCGGRGKIEMFVKLFGLVVLGVNQKCPKTCNF